MIIDAWAQHPTLRHLQDPMFASLRRWTGQARCRPRTLPVAATSRRWTRAASRGA